MEDEKIHPIENHGQIISAIERGAAFGGEIWQGEMYGRQRFPVHEMLVCPPMGRFIVRTEEFAEFDPCRPLWMHLFYRNVLFELAPSQYLYQEGVITCEWPKKISAQEVRSGDRYQLPFRADISLTLKRMERNPRETVMDLEVRIVDVSRKGLGIVISSHNRDFLSHYDHFWIKAIDHRPLDNHIFGSVSYVSEKGPFLKRGDVRVGLCLDAPIEEEVFEYLKRNSHLVLGA